MGGIHNHGSTTLSNLIVETITASQDPISQGWTDSNEEGRGPDRKGTEFIIVVVSHRLATRCH